MAILAVLGIILGLASLFAFIDEMGDITDTYTLMDAGNFVLLTAPRRLYDMLPMAALIGCLIGLGSLASSSELTIMRAAGVSIGRIVWAVMKPMLVLMLAGILIGEYLAPVTENKAQADRSLAQGGGEAQSSKRGMWHRQGDEFVHINSVQPNGLLYGVTRYRFDNERHMQTSSFARRAQYKEDHWLLSDVTTTYFRGDHTEVIKTPEERWDVSVTPQLLNTVVVAPESLSITGLWDYIHYLSDQGLNNARYWLAFWTKVLQPMVTAALVLMAISFIFGPLRSVTLGQRVFTGVLVGFVFRIAQDLLGPSSQVFGFPPLLAVVLPAAICAVAGLWMLRRAG
nr:LPS export ABC transporter permease LptG [Pseudomonas sp. BIGb0427]